MKHSCSKEKGCALLIFKNHKVLNAKVEDKKRCLGQKFGDIMVYGQYMRQKIEDKVVAKQYTCGKTEKLNCRFLQI